MGWQPKKGILLKSFPHSLPVTCVAQPGESGMGFLLRSASANGLSLHALRDLAGIPSVRTFWGADSDGLAKILGMPVSELQGLLVEKGRYMGEPAYLLYEHVFLRSHLLRVSKPQVCVYCVHRTGFCRAMWDCGLYTVCHVHKTPLTEICKGCGKSLRWFRSAVDVCQCGVYLKALDEQLVNDSSAEFTVAKWIASHFEGEARRQCLATGYPHWMDELSLDGLCTLIRAFGIHTKAYQRVTNSSLAKEDGFFWRSVCARALSRLRTCTPAISLTELAPWVWEGCLESMTLVAATTQDQQVASMLLREVFGTVATAKMGSQRSALCQMRLFED